MKKTSELEEELRRILGVLNIPPLETSDISEAKLVKLLNEKDKIIEYLKVEIVNKSKDQDQQKHESQVEEYRVTKLEKTCHRKANKLKQR